MKVIVYLPAADERALLEEGHDPARWVRDAVKAALSERDAQGTPAPSESGKGRTAATVAEPGRDGEGRPVRVDKREASRSESDEVRTDFKGEKKGRR